MDVCLHDDREQGLVDAATPLQQRGEERAGAQLGDVQLHIPGGGGQAAVAVSVALVGAFRAVLERRGPDRRSGLGLDEFLQDPLQHGADHVGVVGRTQ